MNNNISWLVGVSSVLLIAGPTLAAPQEFNADQLDRITAGSSSHPPPNGGAIVGNGSNAELISSGEVVIDNAQTDVRALNIVNSSESTVANGVNIFRSQALVDGDFVLPDVEQINTVVQDQRRLSSLPSYERGANTYSEYLESGSADSSSSNSIVDQITNYQSSLVLDEVSTIGSVASPDAPTLHIDATLIA